MADILPVTPARKLTKDAIFSSGLKIPKGARIAFPTYGIA